MSPSFGRRRRALRDVVLLAALFAPAAPAAAANRTPQEIHPPAYLVDRMGERMSLAQARHDIAFRPFSPPRNVVAAVLLPPFHGADERASRGIAIEYADVSGALFVLAQWPANGGRLTRFTFRHEETPDCRGARTFVRGAGPDGIVWSTPHGLIMSLQTDGKNTDARALQREWSKLIRRGVCR